MTVRFVCATILFMATLGEVGIRQRFAAGVFLLAVFVAGLSLVSAGAVVGQETVRNDLDAEGCSSGTFVADPQNNPDLVADCRTLVGLRNYWVNHPDNVDLYGHHPIFTWGGGKDISDWDGIGVRDGKLVSLGLYCDYSELTATFDCDYKGGAERLTWIIPPEIGNFKNIERLNLFNLSGPLPIEMFGLTSLKELEIHGTAPGVPIPKEIGQLVNLEILSLNGTIFSSSIPPEIGNLTKLNFLYIVDTEISGEIPASIGNLTRLGHLYLNGNLLSGSIPSEIGNLIHLNDLHLYNNRLSGSIPAEIGKLTKLRVLFLHNNDLEGFIPPEIGKLVRAELIDLSYNNLDGLIPIEFGNLNELGSLYLDSNRLSGSIPKELSQMSKLNGLDIENNRLSGIIPKELGDLPMLTGFYFCGNDIEGPVPKKLRQIWESRPVTFSGDIAPVVDPDTGSFFCPDTWRVTSATKTASTNSEIIATLNRPMWSWNTENQIWLSLDSNSVSLSEGTAIAYRAPSIDERTLQPLGLSTTDKDITLTLHNGWNILSAPQSLRRPPRYEGTLLTHHSLTNCDDTPQGIIVIIRYNNRSGNSIEMPCHPERKTQLATAGYSPLNQIEKGDFVYIYFRSVLPVNINWDPGNQTFWPDTS